MRAFKHGFEFDLENKEDWKGWAIEEFQVDT